MFFFFQGYIKVRLDPESEEYQRVSDKFHMVDHQQQNAAMFPAGQQYPAPNTGIKNIYRVQNPKLWKIYSL